MICLTTLVPCGWCSVLLQTCTLLEWILEHLSKDLAVFERYVVGILSETRWQWTYDLHILCLLGIALLTSSFAYSVVLRSAVSSVWTLFKLVSCKFFALLCLCSACTEWRFCVCVEVWSFSSLSMTLQSSHLMHLAIATNHWHWTGTLQFGRHCKARAKHFLCTSVHLYWDRKVTVAYAWRAPNWKTNSDRKDEGGIYKCRVFFYVCRQACMVLFQWRISILLGGFAEGHLSKSSIEAYIKILEKQIWGPINSV